ncbi:MAG: ATP-binding protein [Crocinitomicaceae bacterium]|nr:MAG: ATP-binding protein [Crocinitomicaceae bacterium]
MSEPTLLSGDMTFEGLVTPSFEQKMLKKGYDLRKAWAEGKKSANVGVGGFTQSASSMPIKADSNRVINDLADIEPIYSGFSIDECRDQSLIPIFKAFAERGYVRTKYKEMSFGLMITGKPNVGKTTIASTMLRERIKNSKEDKALNVVGKKVRAYNMVLDIQSAIGSNTHKDVMKHYCTITNLLIDNLAPLDGAIMSQYVRDVLYEIIEFRKNSLGSLWTVITTNSDRNRLIEVCGNGVVDRIDRMCAVVEMKGI